MNLNKKNIWILLLLVVSFSLSKAQEFNIAAGAEFTMDGSQLSLPGSWNNNGTLNAGTGTIVFNGSGLQTITSSSEDNFYNIVVNKSSSNVQLSNNITINGTLTLTSGDFNINSNLLTFGSSASLVETPGNTLTGGEATTTRSLNAPAAVNIMGAIISSSDDLGSTVITRGHNEHISGGNSSILRHYEITPSNNTGLDAALVFSYDESELNGLNESELILFRSTDSGTNWHLAGGIVDTALNTVTFSGISSFSLYTLGASSAPLPVELTSFTASVEGSNVILKWVTATEVNNYGFEIQKSESKSQRSDVGGQTESTEWGAIGFVKGSGNSNSVRDYSFVDKNISPGTYQYRLKQIDNDGQFKYSDPVELSFMKATEFHLAQNYPNPFNPETTIEFTSDENRQATLKIFNSLGEEVAELFNQQAEAGKYYRVKFDASKLSSGVYYARLISGDKQLMNKMLLMK